MKYWPELTNQLSALAESVINNHHSELLPRRSYRRVDYAASLGRHGLMVLDGLVLEKSVLVRDHTMQQEIGLKAPTA